MTNLFPKSWPEWARSLSKVFMAGFAFGVVGYGVGYVLAKFVLPDAGPLPDLNLRWSDAVAAVAAISLVIGAAAVLMVSLDPARLGRMYKLEGPASVEETAQARLQSVVMGLSGVILLLPVIFELASLASIAALTIVVLLLALHTALNLKVYREIDELWRRAVMEAGTITFFVGQVALFLWAAAERLGVVPPITAWDVYAVLMALYLCISVIVTTRRGLA
jgi:hypothetical protein